MLVMVHGERLNFDVFPVTECVCGGRTRDKAVDSTTTGCNGMLPEQTAPGVQDILDPEMAISSNYIL